MEELVSMIAPILWNKGDLLFVRVMLYCMYKFFMSGNYSRRTTKDFIL
jgi:hypothetical protein